MITNYSITFRRPYKSIAALPTIELPPFVVLTGVNGSGKSHLLEALSGGMVRSSIAQDPKTEIALFDWNTIIPNDTGIHIPAQEKVTRANLFSSIRQHRSRYLSQIQNVAQQYGIDSSKLSSWDRVRATLNKESLMAMMSDQRRVDEADKAIRSHLNGYAQQIRGQIGTGEDHFHKAVDLVLEKQPHAFLLDEEDAFFSREEFLWGQIDPFKQAFARLFTNYRELLRSNLVLVGAQARGIKDKPPLDEYEFVQTYGRPPWEFVNSILELNEFDFRIDYPRPSDDGSYEPKLTKLSKSVEMRFSDLSSGERVLMSFALCLYNSFEKRHVRKFPKLLLLDEVDAPLHPSMVKFLLRTIEDTIVRENNVAVILTTHKPTTVGLAADSAIYLMNPSGPALQKTTKSKALAVLTDGIPTMSFSFDGRRQVFVESPLDAQIYDRLYQTYKKELSDERSLNFISVGSTDARGQDRDAGCAQVHRLVNQLSSSGNKSVLGLIDWDGKNVGTSRIHVLCHGERNGLENLILDPVLVIATLAHYNIEEARKIGVLDADDRFTSLSDRDQSAWQRSVDALNARVIGESGKALIPVEYLNKMVLYIDNDWLIMDDHKLEEKFLQQCRR